MEPGAEVVTAVEAGDNVVVSLAVEGVEVETVEASLGDPEA